MALSRVKVWGNEILTAADLNAEFNNILNNASSLISPLSGSLDWDGYAHTLDAVGVTTAQSTASTAWSFVPGSKAGTPSTTGSVSNWAANTYTDSATAGSGTATSWTGHSLQRPTLAATNASVTTTDAATFYIANSPLAGTNETLTNAWSLWVDSGAVRFDGDVHVQGSIVGTPNKFSLTVSMSGNAATISLKDKAGNDFSASAPGTFKFRSATAGTSTYTIGSASGAISTVISSGSTGGTASGIAHRIHIGALLTGSTVELLWWNGYSATTGRFGYSPTELISTTAEGGAGAADTAGVAYSTTARSGVPWVYLGYFESTQATAGTWASAASKVQTWNEGMPYPGQVIQAPMSVDSAAATGTTSLPTDDTIPQNTEGTQFMTCAITPTSAVNVLRVTFQGNLSHNPATNPIISALFQDSTASALFAKYILGSPAQTGVPDPHNWTYHMIAGTTSSTTFKVRAGSNTGGTVTFNGVSGSRVMGGVAPSYLIVEEVFL